jgi:anti-sigma factor RsiW
VDGELDLTESLEIDQHLQECSSCARTCADLQALRATIKGGSVYFAPPLGLRRRILASVRGVNQARPALLLRPRTWLAVAASLAFIVAVGWGLLSVLRRGPAEVSLAQVLVTSHVRSQMLPDHLADVRSTDQHKIKPFFEGRVDFALPAVPDLKDQDFSLIGGRLDYLNDRAVAVLVYQRREHIINLFIWPSTPGAESATKELTRHNYHLIHWTQADMTYWAVSNLNERELQEFVRLFQEKNR